MTQAFKKPYNIKLPKSQHEVEEFGRGKKGVAVCSQCNAAYFKKSWRHGLEKINIIGKKDLPLKFILCPACQMIKNKQYEGRITIRNIPQKLTESLEGLIKGFCRRAYERDPMDRLIEIKKDGSFWVVTTTENELANKLGKKIKNNFNKVKVKTRFNREPGDVGEVAIDFLI